MISRGWGRTGGGSGGGSGKSAFELWLELPENAGKSESEFWESLRGTPGPKGDPGTASVAINDSAISTTQTWSSTKINGSKNVPAGVTTTAQLTESGTYRLIASKLSDIPAPIKTQNTVLQAFIHSDGTKLFLVQGLFADNDFQNCYLGYKHYTGTTTHWRKLTTEFDRKMVGRTLALLGDSIMTMIDKSVIEARTGLSVDISYAHGGSSVALRSNAAMAPTWDPWALCTRSKVGAVNDIPIENFDYAMIFIGTNDWGNYHPLGTQTSTDELTILGAFNVAIQNFITRKPDIKLLLATPMFRDGAETPPVPGYQKLYETCQAIETLAKVRYGIPTVNMMENGMINDFNKVTFLQADLLHPNAAGKDLLSRMFASFIENSY